MECFDDCLYDVYGHSVIISMHWVFEGLRYILIHANTCKYWVNTITYKTIHIYTDQYIPVVARRRSVCPRMHCPAGGILQERSDARRRARRRVAKGLERGGAGLLRGATYTGPDSEARAGEAGAGICPLDRQGPGDGRMAAGL